RWRADRDGFGGVVGAELVALTRVVEAVRQHRAAAILRRQVYHEVALDEGTQQPAQVVEVVDLLHAAGARAQLALRLRAAQQQLAEDGDLDLIDVPGVVQRVPPALDAAAGDLDDQAALLQARQRVLDIVLTQEHHRLAVALLVAAGHQRVEAHRIRV